MGLVLVDWLPFTLVLMAYDKTRGLADALGTPLHEADAVFSTWDPNTPLSRLRRGETSERDGRPSLASVRAACQAARDASHLRLRHGHEPDVRSTEGCRDAERLTVADGDIESAFTGRREQRAGVQVGGADGECPCVVRGFRERREVLDRPGKARVLHEQR